MPFDCLPEQLLTDLVKLKLARDGIAGGQGWSQHELGLTDEPSHCVIGWLLVAADWDAREATRLLVDYVYPALPDSARTQVKGRVSAVYHYNDGGYQTQRRVVRLFDDAIRLAEVT
jgi:hypothetical protein